jgi:ADP-L-glycero-D-manno-heptose 6-epimerase
MSDAADLSTLRPLNMYGYSKHLFDLYAQRRGFIDRIVGLKSFNVFGRTRITKQICAASCTRRMDRSSSPA